MSTILGIYLSRKFSALTFLLITQLTQHFRGGVISPILPLFIRMHGVSLTQIGFLGTAGMLGWLIFEPIAGIFADRLKKKYLLVFAIISSSFIYVSYPFVQNIWHFYILAFASSSVLSAYAISVKALAAELLPETGKGKAYGRYLSIISFGGIIGPLLGGYLAENFGYKIPFYFAGSFGIIGLVSSLLMSYDDDVIRSRSLNLKTSNLEDLFTKSFIGILVIRMAFMFSMVFRTGLLPIFLNESPSFRASQTEIGMYMGIVQLSIGLSNLFLGSLADKFGSKKIIIASLGLGGVSYLGLIHLSGVLSMYFLGALQGVCFAASDLGMMIYLMSIIPDRRTGLMMGIYSESENIGGMIASPSLGLIYDKIGSDFSVFTVSVVLISNAFFSAFLSKGDLKKGE